VRRSRGTEAANESDGLVFNGCAEVAVMTTMLADRSCVSCRGDIPQLNAEERQALLRDLGDGWSMIRDHHLEKTYEVRNFRSALGFANALGEIADQQGHHPEITLARGEVTLRIWTHKIDGLTESDFFFAAKAERAFRLLPSRTESLDRKSTDPPRAIPTQDKTR
jgi:4a-hydroxytetrahydrobiopterin dehydratase